MANSKHMGLKKGQTVRIVLPADTDKGLNDHITIGMRRFDRRQAEVSRVIGVGPNRAAMYELKGVRSKNGIPYTFTRNELEYVKRDINA